MDEHYHGSLIEGISEEYKDILENSDQGVYIYLDDEHKVCNEKFAELLGYESAEEWAGVEKGFTEAFVAEESQEMLVSTFQKAMEQCVGSKIKVSWQKKTGDIVETEVILVPVSYQGHIFALHYVSQK